MTTDAERIAKGLSDLEREWLTGWQGPAGAAYNVIATGLQKRGLLVGPLDWSLSPLGLKVRRIIKESEHG